MGCCDAIRPPPFPPSLPPHPPQVPANEPRPATASGSPPTGLFIGLAASLAAAAALVPILRRRNALRRRNELLLKSPLVEMSIRDANPTSDAELDSQLRAMIEEVGSRTVGR